MFDTLSFASYLTSAPLNWAAHSGGIHPAMPQAQEMPGTHGTAMTTQGRAWRPNYVVDEH